MIPPSGWRRDLAIALMLAAIAAVFRLPRLGYPPEEVFDEVYHAKTALQYLRGEPPTEWVHPPTAKLLIAIGVGLFGYHPWAWRLLPALAGIALAPVFYLLARRVLQSERAALLASVLLLADGVYLVQSRIAMTNIFAVLFQLSAALFVLHSALAERLGIRGMLAAGTALGLAVSTRWTSLWAAGFLGLVLLAVRGRRIFRPRDMGLTLIAFALLPAAIYVAAYIPLMMQRHGRADFAAVKPVAADLIREQVNVWRYHADLNATHPYFSKWYSWPWLYRPTWYYFADDKAAGTVRGILAVGNPALWWGAVPITLWALVTGLRVREPRRIFAATGFCLMYLPWGVAPRTLNYSHYLFEAIPYACLSFGMLLDREWDRGRLAILARVYVVLVVFLFIAFYPFLAALPVPARAFNFRVLGIGPWTWFPKWI